MLLLAVVFGSVFFFGSTDITYAGETVTFLPRDEALCIYSRRDSGFFVFSPEICYYLTCKILE